ncbi:MAG: hypothetical protein IJF76_00310, partial [Clostridia bacterium]|nr:hypothetical protein [Clostridia bacterium]
TVIATGFPAPGSQKNNDDAPVAPVAKPVVNVAPAVAPVARPAAPVSAPAPATIVREEKRDVKTVIDDTDVDDDDDIASPVMSVNNDIPSFLQRIKMKRK